MINLKKEKKGFSLAEALVTLLIVCLITIASIPILTKKVREKKEEHHGVYACYWNGDNLIARSVVDDQVIDGSVMFDSEENRNGCVFNPPPNAKNFVVTIVGGGGGGAASAASSGNYYKYFTDKGEHTFVTPYMGLYEFLVVGGGGGGGTRLGEGTLKYFAGSGNYGDVVYVNPTILAKDTTIKVKVGGGGAVSSGVTERSGTPSSLEVSQLYAEAAGGGVGVTYSFHSPRIATKDRDAHIFGYTKSGILNDLYWIRSNYYPIKPGLSLSDTSTFVKKLGDSYSSPKIGDTVIKGGTGTVHKSSEPVGALSSVSQKINPYNNNPNLTNYSSAFNQDFNKCLSFDGINLVSTIRQDVSKIYCAYNYGAGGGGSGKYEPNRTYWRPDVFPGVDGLVAIKYKLYFAGLGGQAGRVLQLSYSEMPQKTLLFPGKGGNGGKYEYIIASNGPFANNGKTAGKDGQASYIKNGSHVAGGAGAQPIDPGNESTISLDKNDNQMPIGGNGFLADILTSKKTGTGGLGGLQNGNNSVNGLSQTVFKDGASVGTFNRIYGAGSGGGGGTASVSSDSSVTLGNGGNGTSGLVFIQW